MAAYKGFDENTNLTPPPWGARQQQWDEDVVDTLVGDTIQGVKDTDGHKHFRLYPYSGTPTIAIDCGSNITLSAQSDVVITNFTSSQFIGSDTDGHLHQGVISSDYSTYAQIDGVLPLQFGNSTTYLAGDSSAGLNIHTSGHLLLQDSATGGAGIVINTDYDNISITANSSGNVLVTASAGNITITTANGNASISSKNLVLPNIPTSSAGLSTGMVYSSSGVLMIV